MPISLNQFEGQEFQVVESSAWRISSYVDWVFLILSGFAGLKICILQKFHSRIRTVFGSLVTILQEEPILSLLFARSSGCRHEV